jgi:hypothetical protein
MKVFVASSPKVEVNGETVYAIVDGMGVFKTKALKILEDQGIVDPKPGQWYSQQAWLNAFKTISEHIGSSVLSSIGQRIPENAKFPPDIDDIHKALSVIDVAYQMNHRNGEIGHYIYEKTGERSAKLTCTNPYPDEFDKGIIIAMAKKFRSTVFNLAVDIDKSQPVRMRGGDSTTFNVSW